MKKIEVGLIYSTIIQKKKQKDVIKPCQKQILAKSTIIFLRGSKLQEIGKIKKKKILNILYRLCTTYFFVKQNYLRIINFLFFQNKFHISILLNILCHLFMT